MPKVEFSKITSLKFGDVMGDGTMQTVLESVGNIKEGSATLNFAEGEITDINVEESDTAYASVEKPGEKDLTVQLLGIEASALAGLIGGNYSAANASNPEQIAMPPSASAVLKAVQLNCENPDGLPVVVNIPKAKLLFSSSGTITKSDVTGWQFKCKVLQPDDGAGNNTNWMIIKSGNPTA